MALFPRCIDGRYAMIGRQDNENLHLLDHRSLYVGGRTDFVTSTVSLEFVQLGNCGSPIDLGDDGWLLLTHGVGPMRQYAIGAVMLDKRDPSR